MSNVYLNNLKNTPQSQPIIGMNMVKNNAGGFSFQISDKDLLNRFLMIGSEGGTYYVSESKLTLDNSTKIIDMIKRDGEMVAVEAIKVLDLNLAPKAEPALFVIALCATYGNETVKKVVYNAISKICRTSTQFFTLIDNLNTLRGWSSGLRKGVAKFYTSRSEDQLAYQLVKYRQRNGFTHRDALRLCHASSKNSNINSLFAYAVGKNEAPTNKLVAAYEKAKTLTGIYLATHITENKLTWEMVPTEQLSDKDVLLALLANMPVMALIRNLNRFAKAGLTATPLSEATKIIVSKLRNEELIKKANLHPVFVLNATKTYSSGRGFRGGDSWSVNQKIVDALYDTYELATKYTDSTGKNILIAVDVSGSMSYPTVANMSLRVKEAAAALSHSIYRAEDNSTLVWFDTNVYEPKIGRRNSVEEVLNATPNGGGTDTSLPFAYMLHNKEKYDAIIILTDNETWAGKTHSVQLLDECRKINKDLKVVEVAMATNPYSDFPINDVNVLKISGFDASVPNLINKFLV